MRRRGQRIKRCDRRDLKQDFLREYRENSCVAHVCKEIGIARCTFYAWLKRDVTFTRKYRAIIDAQIETDRQAFDATYQLKDDEYWHQASEHEVMIIDLVRES
jgi:hypothetical protein